MATTKTDLLAYARKLNIRGRSTMTKQELMDAVQHGGAGCVPLVYRAACDEITANRLTINGLLTKDDMKKYQLKFHPDRTGAVNSKFSTINNQECLYDTDPCVMIGDKPMYHRSQKPPKSPPHQHGKPTYKSSAASADKFYGQAWTCYHCGSTVNAITEPNTCPRCGEDRGSMPEAREKTKRKQEFLPQSVKTVKVNKKTKKEFSEYMWDIHHIDVSDADDFNVYFDDINYYDGFMESEYPSNLTARVRRI